MAKLLIFRGESLLDERELTEQTLRIGRGAQNDIVLEDPSKGVSREHAELRFEGGRYALFDRESQNGLWVSGTRVPFVVMDPDVSVAVGPYRLMVKAPVSVPAPVPDIPDVETGRAADLTQHPDLAPAPLVLDNIAPPPDMKVTRPPSPPPRVAAPPRPQGKEWYADPRVLGATAAALLLIAVSAFVGYRVTHKPKPEPIWNGDIAQALVASGKCQEALDTQINPTLAQDPNNQAARALRDKCNTPPPPPPSSTTSVPPVVRSISERLDEAEGLLTAKDCPKALELINPVLTEEPGNERAKDLFAKTNTCLNPPPPPPGTDGKPAVPVPPGQGGLVPLPKELDKPYRDRIAAMRKKYEDALALLQSQKYLQARRAFDEIVPLVPTGYLDLMQRREEAITGMRAEARTILEAAQAADKAADKASEFDAAISGYRRAHDLDLSIQVEGPIQRINERKLALGRTKCADGRVEFSFGNNAAANGLLQEAVKLLPPSDPCAIEARKILQKEGK